MSSDESPTPDEYAILAGEMGQHVRDDVDGEAQALPPQLEENAEEALESHEVIELQAFIERKEWIEEKIKLLESLHSIDAFAGTDDLSKTHESSGLATRAQLEDWMAEHDRIEKETEMFDTGDLNKLRKLTKAATQRNLSPQDTDLIELTLTTLYALDRLLHLLRARSEHLELLNLRLTWEDHRLSAFKCQKGILEDLRGFLAERARWTQDVYTNGIAFSSSSTSLPNSGELVSSESSESMSRSTRFKLAEGLSKDAVQFSSRVTALRHGHVAASGKILDKLIDNSRKPVPDSMLDEQDRLEEKCANELEAIGKFAMLVVMQWKKADEMYIETKKDKANIRSLSEDIIRALANPPIRRLESNFSGRVDILRKRILNRIDPASPASTFPLPIHQLFPEQSSFNQGVVNILSSELRSARQMVNEAGELVKGYRARCEAIEGAENVLKDILEIRKNLSQISDHLENGFVAYDGDGSPPDLNHQSCVDPMRFSAYLAMLPTLMEQITTTRQTVSETVRRARLSVLHLEKTEADDAVKQTLMSEIGALQRDADATDQLKDAISHKVSTLREVRRIWSTMDDISKSLDVVAEELKEALVANRWKQEMGGDNGPLTPESSQASLPIVPIEAAEVDGRLLGLKLHIESELNAPVSRIQDILPDILRASVLERQKKTQRFLRDLQNMNDLLSAIRTQTLSMEGVRDEAHILEGRIEEAKMTYDQCLQDIVSFSESEIAFQIPSFTDEDIMTREESLGQLVVSLQHDVELFVNSLTARVPFVSRRSTDTAPGIANVAEVSLTETSHPGPEDIESTSSLPFDPAAIDRIVRNDSNAYSLLLSGALRSLLYKQSHLSFFKSARTVSKQLTNLGKDILAVDELLNGAFESYTAAHSPGEVTSGSSKYLDSTSSIKAILEGAATQDSPRVSQTISAIRGLMNEMRNMPGLQDDVNHFGIFTTRSSKLDELDLRWHRVVARLESIRVEVNTAYQNEIARLQREAEALEAARLAERLKQEQEEANRRKEEQENAERRKREEEEAERRKKEEEEAERRKREEDAAERRRKADEEAKLKESERAIVPSSNGTGLGDPEDDIFAADYPTVASMDENMKAMLDHVRSLRKGLKSIGLEAVAYPPESSRRMPSTASLPTMKDVESISGCFESIRCEASALPLSTGIIVTDNELRSLREDIAHSQKLGIRIQQLGQLSHHVILCDAAFSEFLDHIDSYPALPNTEDPPKRTELDISPEDRLQERMSHTKGIFGDMSEHFRPVADDTRAISEHNRLRQTWDELMEMGLEKLHGRPSRPPSAYSSGRNSSASISSSHAPDNKRKAFSKLSVGRGRGGPGFLVPSTQRRVVSSSSTTSKAREDAPSRSSLAISRSQTPRSVSGPMSPPTSTSSLFSSTFASRQRTTSLSSTSSVLSGGGKARAVPSVMGRRMSNVQAESTRTRSPSVSTPRGTWPRAPRQSFSSVPRAATPDRSATRRKQKYVANPKNKLDVAVGDVVNNLPVDINVEVVADTWKDKSGKYWIGGSEPKLCFVRILRSQTVMVRVGGGWAELSRFIKDHFADLFRLMPESPPRTGPKEEKWISASILQAAEENEASNKPRSPESAIKHLPSFAFSTPDGSLSEALPSTPSIGAPLTPLQFLRRAERDPSELSLSSLALSTATVMSTPSKSHLSRSKVSIPTTPSKHAAWRP